MPITAIIPIRSFEQGKGRLEGHISTAQRIELGMGMAERTVAAAEESNLIPTIVSAATDVADWAFHLGLLVLDELAPGLNAAASRGSEWAEAGALRWVILHSDLPLVSAADLAPIVAVVESGGDVIAPSCDGGTSAISSRIAFGFRYGPGSFHHHLPRLDSPEVITSPGLLQDLDSYDDLKAASTHPRGTWLQHLVS